MIVNTKIKIESKEQWLKLRTQVLTSTDCATLFNLSPYQTMFELWHKKKSGDIIAIEENQRMKWGNRLESAIAHGAAEEHGWKVSEMKDFYKIEDLKLGSSFDFHIENENAILEIKNVDGMIYRNNWSENEAPPHIELQVQFQMLVSGIDKAYICALVGGNDIALIERSVDDDIRTEILRRADAFWKSLETGVEPVPDYERDAEYIIKLNQFAEPNKVYDGDTMELLDIAKKYKDLGEIAKDAETKRKALKARCLEIIGDSEKVKSKEFSISAGIIGPKTVSYTTEPYRDFRITLKKEATI